MMRTPSLRALILNAGAFTLVELLWTVFRFSAGIWTGVATIDLLVSAVTIVLLAAALVWPPVIVAALWSAVVETVVSAVPAAGIWVDTDLVLSILVFVTVLAARLKARG